MSVKPHLQTSLSQRLVLTPQMRQRIEMLQMTKLELSDMILAELDQNPLLDEAELGTPAEDQTEETAEEVQAAAKETPVAGAEVTESAVETASEAEPDIAADVDERDSF